MTYGSLSDDQAKVVRRHVAGRVVHDLGAGNCEHSVRLLELGARSVVAVDKESMPLGSLPGVTKIRDYFEHFVQDEPGPLDVAFVSWPVNRANRGLLELVRRTRTVIYLGRNTNGNMCAWPGFFRELANRAVLDYVPEKRNTLIVYGDRLEAPRKRLYGEERAGLTSLDGEWTTFEEAEGITG